MKNFYTLLPALLLCVHAGAAADPWKDESGHGRKERREYREFKEEYWDGNCKVKREFKKDGEYKEKRECKPYRREAREHRHRYAEPAGVYLPRPPAVIVEPGIVVHGTVRVPY